MNLSIEKNDLVLEREVPKGLKVDKLPRMCRAKELAYHTGTSKSTIWRWAKEGKIKPYKISAGTTLFDMEEVMSDLGLV